jgi:hypothetical protein
MVSTRQVTHSRKVDDASWSDARVTEMQIDLPFAGWRRGGEDEN